jgi:hypothetical protein
LVFVFGEKAQKNVGQYLYLLLEVLDYLCTTNMSKAHANVGAHFTLVVLYEIVKVSKSKN